MRKHANYMLILMRWSVVLNAMYQAYFGAKLFCEMIISVANVWHKKRVRALGRIRILIVQMMFSRI